LDKKIMILLPIWKREKITRICLDNLKELQKDFNIDVICVVSEQWSKLAAFEYGFRYVEAPNECIGAKMNIGVREAIKFDFDYMMNLGSDDIITKELFDIYEPYFKDGLKMFGSRRVTFIDSESKEVKRNDYQAMIGAGRCIRKDIIVEVLKSGEMYDKVQKGLDFNSQAKFIRHNHTEIENPFNTIFDIKSCENIWGFNDLGGDKVGFEEGVKGLSTSQIDRILEL